jgi:hypothetical protein
LDVLEGVYHITEQNLEYFFRFEGYKAMLVDDMRKHYLSMAHEITNVAQRSGQDVMRERADTLFNEFYNIYVGRMGI